MSIQDMEDLKQHYLDEMKSLINDLQIKDYRNERIDIQYRRECEIRIDELKQNFNGMSIEIRKKEKELLQQEHAAYVRTSQRFNFIYYDDDDDEESSIPLRDIIISGLPPVEDLVPIPSESEGFSESNDDSTSIDDDSFSIDDIDNVEASPPQSELVSLEEVKDFHPEDGELEDDVLREKLSKINILIAKIEALNANPTPSSDFVLKSPIPIEDGDSLKKFETTLELVTFKFDMEEMNSGSTTIHADISLPDLEGFYFKSEPDPRDLTSINNLGIRENVSSTTNVNLPFENDQSPLFAYVVWIFLLFLTYPVAPPYLLSSGNEDTIFDPGISIYHSFMPGVSHRSGTFMKFNVYPNHLNESSMEILSSTCFPMDQ
ncbi:hypothetical protein Tco_0843128 [Tanacetum coccineum]|uniref:Uncharacterized protein n=1 Tax=Tanacetum coccineum TaxID=301880 RepID=A0ABQ5B243_9ASTR